MSSVVFSTFHVSVTVCVVMFPEILINLMLTELPSKPFLYFTMECEQRSINYAASALVTVQTVLIWENPPFWKNGRAAGCWGKRCRCQTGRKTAVSKWCDRKKRQAVCFWKQIRLNSGKIRSGNRLYVWFSSSSCMNLSPKTVNVWAEFGVAISSAPFSYGGKDLEINWYKLHFAAESDLFLWRQRGVPSGRPKQFSSLLRCSVYRL